MNFLRAVPSSLVQAGISMEIQFNSIIQSTYFMLSAVPSRKKNKDIRDTCRGPHPMREMHKYRNDKGSIMAKFKKGGVLSFHQLRERIYHEDWGR